MNLQVKGIQELVDYFDKQSKLKIGKKALKKAGLHVLKVERKVARRRHYRYSNKVGYKELKNFPLRNKNGNVLVDIGIKGKKVDWQKIKGIYYNHYGFWHNKTGQYVAGSRWMDTAYVESVEGAYKIIAHELTKELDVK